MNKPPTIEPKRKSPDERIRAAGFKIKDRPRVGADIWVRDGRKYTFNEALAMAKKEGK